MRDKRETIQQLWDQIEQAPQNFELYRLLAHSYSEEGWTTDAVGVAERLVEINPKEHDPIVLRLATAKSQPLSFKSLPKDSHVTFKGNPSLPKPSSLSVPKPSILRVPKPSTLNLPKPSTSSVTKPSTLSVPKPVGAPKPSTLSHPKPSTFEGRSEKNEVLESSHEEVSQCRQIALVPESPEMKTARLQQKLDQSLDHAATMQREAQVLADVSHSQIDISRQFSDTANALQRSIEDETNPEMIVPRNVRRVARTIATADENERLDVAFEALKEMVDWMRSPHNPQRQAADRGKEPASGIIAYVASFIWTPADAKSEADELRTVLVNRRDALTAALSEPLRWLALSAFMHIEHEVLHRQYVNNETMVEMEPVGGIPRDRFWASEDGYAFDMQELVEALEKGGAGGGGAMRNPLSLQLFTADDVAAIVKHPLGQRLAILQDKQSRLQRGLSARTVIELEKLAETLHKDETDTQQKSHEALDQWNAHLARLSKPEVDALNGLKVPAVDSHTRLRYNATIGEMVQDVQGNRVCNHKAGDFLRQAVKFLHK